MTWERSLLAAILIALLVWFVATWRQPEPEPGPAFRHTRLYDQCLAQGGSTTVCDAALRIIIADREKARRAYEEECLKDSGMPDNLFAKVACEAPQ